MSGKNAKQIVAANEACLRRAEDGPIVFVDENLVEADPPGFGSRAARRSGMDLMPAGRGHADTHGLTQAQLVKQKYATLNPGTLDRTSPTG